MASRFRISAPCPPGRSRGAPVSSRTSSPLPSTARVSSVDESLRREANFEADAVERLELRNQLLGEFAEGLCVFAAYGEVGIDRSFFAAGDTKQRRGLVQVLLDWGSDFLAIAVKGDETLRLTC